MPQWLQGPCVHFASSPVLHTHKQVYLVLKALTASDAELNSWSSVEDMLANPGSTGEGVQGAGTSRQQGREGEVGQQQEQQGEQQQEQQHPAVIERFSHEVPVPDFTKDSGDRKQRGERVVLHHHGTTFVWTSIMASVLFHAVCERIKRLEKGAPQVSKGKGSSKRKRGGDEKEGELTAEVKAAMALRAEEQHALELCVQRAIFL